MSHCSGIACGPPGQLCVCACIPCGDARADVTLPRPEDPFAPTTLFRRICELEKQVADLKRPSKRFVYDAVRNVLVNELGVGREQVSEIIGRHALKWLTAWAETYAGDGRLLVLISSAIREHVRAVLRERISIAVEAKVSVGP